MSIPVISYIDISYAERQITRDRKAYLVWKDLNADEKILFLNDSARALDVSFVWAGRKFSINQQMEFPRYFDPNDTLNGEVPLDVKKAQILILAYLIKTENYDEFRTAAELGIKTISDEVSASTDFGFKQIPEEAALLLVPFSRLNRSMNQADKELYDYNITRYTYE